MAKSIESLVEKEIQKGSTPLKLDSVMVPAEGFRDIDNRERLINILQYLLRVREHKKLIWNDTLSANNVYMDVFLGKTDFHRASLITGREEIYQHINWYGGKLKPDYSGKTVIETAVCAFSIAEDELEKCRKIYDGKEAYSFYFGKYQIRSLYADCLDYIAGGETGLANDEKGIIDRCIEGIYDEYFKDPRPEKMPILEDLYNALVKYEPDKAVSEELAIDAKQKAVRIANSLVLYVHGSQNYFNHRTNVDSQNRIVCFDIRDLGKQLKELGMLIVQDAVWNRVSRNRERRVATRYYCDEFHLLLRDKQTAQYSVEIWKRFRKWGGIPTGLTQNVGDFLRSEEIEGILGNSDFVYLLNQNAKDQVILADKLGLSETQLQYVTNSESGCGLILFNDVVIPFVDRYPTDTKTYAIMNTRPQEEEEHTADKGDDADGKEKE